MKITIVAGARPNFMKIAPIIKAILSEQKNGIDIHYRLVHTGQHYDKKMSSDFFEQLRIPEPNVNLEAGSGTQAEQTAAIMMRFEKELQENKPDIVLVVGDVTSTMACAITAKKLCIDVGHVEAGLRSGDMTMPEEINRIVTDAICDQFFTTTEMANENLIKRGIESARIHFVGNTMIDTLYQNLENLQQPGLWETYKLREKNYYLVTLHRPVNVDNTENLSYLMDVIINETGEFPIIFPVHPRTKKNLDEKYSANPKLILVEPMGYLEFIFLIKNTKAVITDSGGITEEATVLNIPCLTLRNTTERPETVMIGSNELIGTDPNNLIPYLQSLQKMQWKKAAIPSLWDGKTSNRIVEKLIKLYSTAN
ncbi:MAG: non-hydrolyzing UDP-N-acetylglucosamine 2-epimerase [Chitinophagales bacterium]